MTYAVNYHEKVFQRTNLSIGQQIFVLFPTKYEGSFLKQEIFTEYGDYDDSFKEKVMDIYYKTFGNSGFLSTHFTAQIPIKLFDQTELDNIVYKLLYITFPYPGGNISCGLYTLV